MVGVSSVHRHLQKLQDSLNQLAMFFCGSFSTSRRWCVRRASGPVSGRWRLSGKCWKPWSSHSGKPWPSSQTLSRWQRLVHNSTVIKVTKTRSYFHCHQDHKDSFIIPLSSRSQRLLFITPLSSRWQRLVHNSTVIKVTKTVVHNSIVIKVTKTVVHNSIVIKVTKTFVHNSHVIKVTKTHS